MKLFCIEVVYKVLVRAEIASEAEKWVWSNYEETLMSLGDPDTVKTLTEVLSEADIPEGWDGGIPFGHNPHNNSCNELLDNQAKLGFIDGLSKEEVKKILSSLEFDYLKALLKGGA